MFGPPNVAKLEAAGKIDGLVKAAKYKKDPAGGGRRAPRPHRLPDKIIQRLQTKNLVQLNTAREALVIIGEPARDRLIFILGEGHLHRRQDAAFVLGMMKDPAAVKPLCVGLHNPDPLLRMLIVRGAGQDRRPGGRRHAAARPWRPGRSRVRRGPKALKKIGALPGKK